MTKIQLYSLNPAKFYEHVSVHTVCAAKFNRSLLAQGQFLKGEKNEKYNVHNFGFGPDGMVGCGQ